MIILDLNQVMISNLMKQVSFSKTFDIEENMVRHMVLNSIRSLKMKFSSDYGELVIACDNKNCWRRNYFPYYKANRKKAREESSLDWNIVFNCLDKIRQELKEFFPYRVIDLETAEADDIIATLVMRFGSVLNTGERILILSGDKDFIQLHKFANVSQYDPVNKRVIEHNSPSSFLKEHIIRGDSGDGVPNILSPDNCFVLGQRQKMMTAKKLSFYFENDIDEYDYEAKRNYMRNSMLIDLTNVPNELQEKINNLYDCYKLNSKHTLINYFINNKLKLLMEHINEF
jgi:hypothetical protein